MNRSRWLIRGVMVCLSVLLLWGVGCGPVEEPKKEPPTTEPPKTEPPKETGLTYHKDVRALIEQKCVNCHSKGNVGPFALSSYEDVSKLKMAIKDSVSSGRMPPWKADNSCNDYKGNLGMTKKQVKLIVDWVDQGAKEGDVASYKAPKIEPPPTLREDVKLKLPKPYVPQKTPDDYHCFIMDWPHKEDKYVTGFKVTPGNRKITHHLIAYVIPPKHIATFQKFDDDEEGVGYTCYGGPTGGDGNNLSALTGIRWVGAWAPGGDVSKMPEGTGVLVPGGSKVVVQMHYNASSKDVEPDQSDIIFEIADKVDNPATIQPFTNVSWVLSKSMEIPANSSDTKHTYATDIATRAGGPVVIHSVGFHMHTRGKSGSIEIERGEQSKEENVCALRINKWDFNWQGSYGLMKPLIVYPGDKVRITCTWDNTAENQPLVDGKKVTPRDINWGEGTHDEMCLGTLFLTALKQ